jgi:hypothetical protein
MLASSSIRSSPRPHASGALASLIAIAGWLLSAGVDLSLTHPLASTPGAARAASVRSASPSAPAKQVPVAGAAVGPPQQAVATPGEAALRTHFERYVLNALLVPVLDDEALPLRFGDPSLRMACGTGAGVEVDGQPLRPGAAQTHRFTLRWRLDRCLPFGLDGPLLDGLAELHVQREGAGLKAHVRFDPVIVQRDGVAIVLAGALEAHTP